MLVVGDVADVFVPLVDGLFVSPKEAEAAIDRLVLGSVFLLFFGLYALAGRDLTGACAAKIKGIAGF